MKWYNRRTFLAHKADLKVQKQDKLMRYINAIHQVAMSFPKDSIAIGCLDSNDLLQAGYIGLLSAWGKVDWETIEQSTNPDGTLWSFLKKRIKWEIKREIDKYSQAISTPINQLEQARANLSSIDKTLVNAFPKFFDDEVMYIPDSGPWISLQLEEIIETELEKVETKAFRRNLVLEFYGIGLERKTIKQLSNKYKLNATNTQVYIHRTVKKLNTLEFKKIIENFYNDVY